MHEHRNAGADPAPRRANTPPPSGNVQGLGLVDALRIDVQPAQLPWLADEIDVLRGCFEDELAHQRARYDKLPEAAKEHDWPSARESKQELDRRAYQLRVLAMIREQMPISREATAAAIASPWDAHTDGAESELERLEEPVAVVGPAALMTALVRGATRNVADALAEALRGPRRDVDENADSTIPRRGSELPRVTPAVAEQLRGIATAAQTFTDTYLHVLAHQAYSFDPVYTPLYADELE